jgi:hypothetical protein
MTGEIARSGRSERSAVWAPNVVRRAERTFAVDDAGGSFRKSVGLRPSARGSALVFLAQT